ncbi:HEAT repeat domain-containing protein [Bremerella cremea]|uniref:HEAT repeat domain-containing protein n=1 Tax=Bremerella cremea TaxID=1031537 RepID=UPI0031EBADBD
MRFLLILVVVILACRVETFAQAPQPSLEDLVAIVQGEDAIKSAEAISAIGLRKPTSDLAIQTVVDSLADDRRAVFIPDYVPITFPVDTVGTTAVEALAEIGKPAVVPICECLNRSQDPDVRKLAIRSLSKMEEDAADALPTLERLLGDPDKAIRLEAVAAIVSVQKDPQALALVLGTTLNDASPDVRAAAIQALGELGEAGSRNVPRLVELLDDKENRWHYYAPDAAGTRPVRYDSALALAGMGKEAEVALVKLRPMMSGDSDPLVRVAAAFAIARLDGDSKGAVDHLIAAVQDDESATDVPEEAAEALGKLGPQAEAALPVLDDALRHPETMVRFQAVKAIVSISPETAKSRLLKSLKDEDALVRSCVIESLGALPNPSPQLLNAYIAALDDNDIAFGIFVRHAAAVALGNLKEQASTALPRLKEIAQEEENDWVREAAEAAVQQISQGEAEEDGRK